MLDDAALAPAFVPAAEPDPSSIADGFDRARVLDLVALLERDIALVEQAMTSLEAGEHRSAEAALSVLEAAGPAQLPEPSKLPVAADITAEAGSVPG